MTKINDTAEFVDAIRSARIDVDKASARVQSASCPAYFIACLGNGVMIENCTGTGEWRLRAGRAVYVVGDDASDVVRRAALKLSELSDFLQAALVALRPAPWNDPGKG